MVISTTTDDGRRKELDRLRLPFDGGFDDLDKILDDAGYLVVRFEEDCPMDCIFGIVCCQLWQPTGPDDPPTYDPITDYRGRH